MPEILPSILVPDAETFRERLSFPGFWQPGMTAHVDILDGSMFGAKCFCDPAAIDRSHLVEGIELHCMVQNPLPIIEQWKKLIPQTCRAIVHMEMNRSVNDALEEIRALELETGVALCPETSLNRINTLSTLPDRVLIMGIHPGASGKTFLGEEILARIRRLRSLHPELIIAVDGGVTHQNASSIIEAGANALIAGSAIWQEKNPRAAYEKFTDSSLLHDENDF